MPSSLRALSIVAAVMLARSNTAAQQPASAGATRPKLEVLQALPEAQLFPLMNLLADSLGVRCDYCHVQESPDLTKSPSNVGGWKWDRDDKAPKQTAREMMRMVIDLNARSFHGEPRVTCVTCHRGSTRPDRTPPMPPPPAPGGARMIAPPPLPSGDRVWTNYVNAVGQADARGGGAIVISGWDDRPEGRYGKVEITLADGDRYRINLATPNGPPAIQGMDGNLAWAVAGDRVVQVSAPADVARMRRIAMRYRPVKERPSDLRVVGIERLADRDVSVATGRLDAITTQTMYFDIVTGLLRRDVITTETLLLPLEDQSEYDDYRDVNGVKLPFQVRTSDGAPYDTVTRTFLEIKRNVPVDDAVFRPPSTAR